MGFALVTVEIKEGFAHQKVLVLFPPNHGGLSV
jgi:hypothetical protein